MNWLQRLIKWLNPTPEQIEYEGRMARLSYELSLVEKHAEG